MSNLLKFKTQLWRNKVIHEVRGWVCKIMLGPHPNQRNITDYKFKGGFENGYKYLNKMQNDVENSIYFLHINDNNADIQDTILFSHGNADYLTTAFHKNFIIRSC